MTRPGRRCESCGIRGQGLRKKARRLICAVGTIAGAVGGAAGAASGAELGALTGAFTGPPSVVFFGGRRGRCHWCSVCGTAAGSAGAVLDEILEENILDNFRCLTCEICFGNKREEVLEPIFSET